MRAHIVPRLKINRWAWATTARRSSTQHGQSFVSAALAVVAQAVPRVTNARAAGNRPTSMGRASACSRDVAGGNTVWRRQDSGAFRQVSDLWSDGARYSSAAVMSAATIRVASCRCNRTARSSTRISSVSAATRKTEISPQACHGAIIVLFPAPSPNPDWLRPCLMTGEQRARPIPTNGYRLPGAPRCGISVGRPPGYCDVTRRIDLGKPSGYTCPAVFLVDLRGRTQRSYRHQPRS